MRDADACTAAAAAAIAWGRPAQPPRLVQNRENAVFDVTFDDGRRVALRLHRAGYQSAQAIEAELRWTESLADAGFACPWPQRGADGQLVDDRTGRAASAVQWIDGTPLLATPPEALPALYRDLGAHLADLHLTSDMVAPTGLPRPDWRAQAFCGDAPLWGRYWENPGLTAPEAALLRTARDTARDRLSAIPAAQTGLIHADVLMENVLLSDGQMFLIDFDDGGVGYRLYDLATALIQHCDSPRLPDLRAALLEGYSGAGGPLPQAALEDLEMFVMLRALASAGWVLGRFPATDPRHRLYADRAVRLARGWLG